MRIPLGGLCASLLLTFAAAAQNSGPASNGDFDFALTGASGGIEFNARAHGSSAQGQMTFTGTSEISNADDDDGDTTALNVSLTVSFDCLRISGNQAAMSGTISSSSVPEYIGLRALLAVEDGGEGVKNGPDKFTWGVYRTNAVTWIPVDAEDENDTGATLTWLASDAERLDDVPVASNQLNNGTVDCKSFPFGSYAFEDLPHGAGNIQVKP
jgi:hypothetical protein